MFHVMSHLFRTPPPPSTPRVRERGQAAVEFALVLPVLAMLLFGTVEFGSAFWTYQQVSAAASEGARTAAVSRTSNTRTSDVSSATTAASPNLKPAKMTVSTSSTWVPGAPVTVQVTHRLDSVGMGLLSTFGFSGTFNVSRTSRVEQ